MCFDKPTPIPFTLPWAEISREIHTALQFWEQTARPSTLFLMSRLREHHKWGGGKKEWEARLLWNAVCGMAATLVFSHEMLSTASAPKSGVFLQDEGKKYTGWSRTHLPVLEVRSLLKAVRAHCQGCGEGTGVNWDIWWPEVKQSEQGMFIITCSLRNYWLD